MGAEGFIWPWSAELHSDPTRRQRLSINQDQARDWLHFAENDSALLHSAPQRPVERWETR